MIGNDVIDLSIAYQHTKWKRQRFLDKLFTEGEKAFIVKNKDPQLLLWLFWSMKESTYKANQRRFGLQRKYNPQFFECILNEFNKNQIKATVIAGDYSYKCSSLLDSEKIHTVSSAVEGLDIDFDVLKSTSTILKSNFIKRISEIKNINIEIISLKYDQYSVPQLFLNSQKLDLPFSFSHHCRFSAYAYASNLLMKNQR